MELLRVVDKLGNDTNEIIEREELHNRGKLHNEVTIYIVNDKGEVLLQRRSKNRRFCPNKLGVIAGHQSYREDILTCAVRETKEEVGLKIKKEDLHPLCDKYLVEEKYNNHYMYPYYVICNQKAEDFTIQKEELSFVRWYKIEEVIRLIEVGSKEIVFKKDEIRLFKKLLEVTKKDEKESFFLKIKKLIEVN